MHKVTATYRSATKNKWATYHCLHQGTFEECAKYAEDLADNCTNEHGWLIEVYNEVGKVVWCETFFGEGAEYPLQSNCPVNAELLGG
jgi:hypothetical protein